MPEYYRASLQCGDLAPLWQSATWRALLQESGAGAGVKKRRQIAALQIHTGLIWLYGLVLFFTVSPARADYLFTYFTNNGEDGLHLAGSSDGYHWDKLGGGRSFLQPVVGRSKLMRDPCVARGPDGTYQLVWTSGWTENDIGHASTTDFITWSAEQEIPVMAGEPTTKNAWAPEIVFDDEHGEFVIFWASTVPARFPLPAGASEKTYNHRIYATTTKDFVGFTPTRLFFDPGYNVIDATFLRAFGRRYLVFKDERPDPPKKFIQFAEADSFRGPFGQPSPRISPAGLWAEGPTAIQIGNEVIVYFDAYRANHYGAIRSHDLRNWEDVTSQMSFPDAGTPLRMRHGTVIEVPRELRMKLSAAN